MPEVSVQNAQMSPDGKFIALAATRNFASGEPVSVLIIERSSGKVLARQRQKRTPALQWGEADEPDRLDIDGTPHFFRRTGSSWKLGIAGTSAQESPPPWVVARYEYPQIQAILPPADLAVWYLNNGETGRGDLVASALSDESEVWLPASISKDRNSGTTTYAAPRHRSGAPRRLATLFRRDILAKKWELEAWNLSAHTPIFRRTFGDDVGKMAWTRDGSRLIVTGVPRPQKRDGKAEFASNGVDIYDAATGKQRVALTLEGLDADFSISNDGRYFLTVENTWKGRQGTGRLAIRNTSDGQIVSRFDRQKRIEAEPKFAPGNPPRLIWSSKDTVFLQPWRVSKTALKLKPQQLKIHLD